MRELFLQYLKNKHYVELLVLAIIVLVLFFVLVSTPFRIHDWVVKYRVALMWGEVAALSMMVIVLYREISDMKVQISRLMEENPSGEVKEQVEMYNFYDEKGDLKLSVRPQMLYYLEGADNYVQIHYLNAGRVEKMLIRNTLKNIEWRFRDKDLIRCHRSYIVNMKMVKLLKRVDGEAYLDFGDNKIDNIPVSKGYGDAIIQSFT